MDMVKINRIFVNLRRMTWQMDSIVTVWIAKAEDEKTVKVGTRGSMLALAQTELVIKALKERFSQIDFQMITMSTRGIRTPAERFWNSEAKRYLSRSSRKLYLKVT